MSPFVVKKSGEPVKSAVAMERWALPTLSNEGFNLPRGQRRQAAAEPLATFVPGPVAQVERKEIQERLVSRGNAGPGFRFPLNPGYTGDHAATEGTLPR